MYNHIRVAKLVLSYDNIDVNKQSEARDLTLLMMEYDYRMC